MSTVQPRRRGRPRLRGIRVRALAFVVLFAIGLGFLFDELPFYVPWAAVGTMLTIRRPANVIGLLLIAAGWAYGLAARPIDDPLARLAAGAGTPIDAALIFSNMTTGILAYVVLFAVTATFPSGRLPRGRWGVAARLAILVGALIAASSVLPSSFDVADSHNAIVHLANPLGGFVAATAVLTATAGAAYTAMALILVAGVVSMFVRLRHASGLERLQLRWVVMAFAALVGALLLAFSSLVLGMLGISLNSDILWVPALLAYPLPPIAIGIAILRYRLYEIDRIVSRTISWALVTGLLAGVLLVGVAAIQALLAPLTQENTIAVAASTLAVAALFQPVRRRVQRAVDRRFHRSRYDAERTLHAFAGHLRDEVDLARLNDAVVVTANDAVRPSSSGLWLREGSR